MDNPLPPVDPATPAKPVRGLRIALFVSLAMNIAVVCAVAGFFLSDKVGGGPPRGFDFGVGPFAAAFDKEERDDIRRLLEARNDVRPLRRRDMIDRFNEIADVMRQEPFDADQLTEAFSGIRGRTTELQIATQTIVIEKLADMTAEERAVFADKLIEAINRRGPRRSN